MWWLCPTLCGSAPMEKELMPDHQNAHVYLTTVKDKLPMEENLTLGEALTITRQVEVKKATLLSSASTVQTAPIQAADVPNTRFQSSTCSSTHTCTSRPS